MTTTALAPPRANAERQFYMAMILAMIAAMLLGFARTFFLRPLFPGFPSPPETIFYLHGALYVGWMGLLLVQGSLISAGNTALHMRLGKIAFGLVPLMVIVGIYAALVAARRPSGFVGIPLPPLQFLTVVLGDMVMFPLFAGLALAYRRQPQVHKRFILLACIVFMDPSIGRWPFAFIAENAMASFWIKCLFLVPMAIWDVTTLRRIHWATLVGGVVLIGEGLLRGPLGETSTWLAFAKWATGLLG